MISFWWLIVACIVGIVVGISVPCILDAGKSKKRETEAIHRMFLRAEAEQDVAVALTPVRHVVLDPPDQDPYLRFWK